MTEEKKELLDQSIEIIKKYTDDQDKRNLLDKVAASPEKETIPDEVLLRLLYDQRQSMTLQLKKEKTSKN